MLETRPLSVFSDRMPLFTVVVPEYVQFPGGSSLPVPSFSSNRSSAPVMPPRIVVFVLFTVMTRDAFIGAFSKYVAVPNAVAGVVNPAVFVYV